MSSIYVLNRSVTPVTIVSLANARITLPPGLVVLVDAAFNWMLPNSVEIVSAPPGPPPQGYTAPTVIQAPILMQDSYGHPLGSYVNPLYVANSGVHKTIIPTVTASSYSSGYVVGGIMHFVGMLPASLIGKLDTIELTFKATVQTIEMDVAVFNTLPIGTYADHGAPTIDVTDTAKLIDIFAMTANKSGLGSHTIYTLNGINKRIVGVSPDLFAVVFFKGGASSANLASTAEMALSLGTTW